MTDLRADFILLGIFIFLISIGLFFSSTASRWIVGEPEPQEIILIFPDNEIVNTATAVFETTA